MLVVSDLRKTYPTGDEALQGVDLSVEGSETVAMIGPSGAGKSTFIRCINRLTEPTRGEVWLDETELTALGDDALRAARRDIGMIFQEYNLVERLTVMENVLTGRLGYVSAWQAFRRTFPGEDIERAYELLDRVGLGGMADKRVDELSGGQRQRVGIARAVIQQPKILLRAVIQQPKILLVDEPTSSLDPETSETVMELLTEIAAEQAVPVLINIHEVDLALDHADRIVGLHDGELVFEGTPDDLDERGLDTVYRGAEPATTDTSGSADTPGATTADGDQPRVGDTEVDDPVVANTRDRSANGGV